MVGTVFALSMGDFPPILIDGNLDSWKLKFQ